MSKTLYLVEAKRDEGYGAFLTRKEAQEEAQSLGKGFHVRKSQDRPDLYDWMIAEGVTSSLDLP